MNPLAHDCANCTHAVHLDLVVGRHEAQSWTCGQHSTGFPAALACPYYAPRRDPVTPDLKES